MTEAAQGKVCARSGAGQTENNSKLFLLVKMDSANMKRCGAVWQRVGLISLETPMSLDRSQATLHFFWSPTKAFFLLRPVALNRVALSLITLVSVYCLCSH
jgi:hypothetical protein